LVCSIGLLTVVYFFNFGREIVKYVCLLNKTEQFEVQRGACQLMCLCGSEEEVIGEMVAEESVQVTQRDVDKTPVMELLQRLSDSEPPLEPLHLRM